MEKSHRNIRNELYVIGAVTKLQSCPVEATTFLS